MGFSTTIAQKKQYPLLLLTMGALVLSTIASANLTPDNKANHIGVLGAVEGITFDLENIETLSNTSSLNVNFCKVYASLSVCQYCIRDYYLKDGVCVALDYANLINGCNVYHNATTCVECDNKFAPNLAQNGCVAVNAEVDCLVYATINTCKTCKPGAYLNDSLCNPILNCAAVRTDVIGLCGECQSGFILSANSKVCLAVTNLVDFCVAYSANGVCKACNPAYALKPDGSYCYSKTELNGKIDPNCVRNVVNNGQRCDLCKPGFIGSTGDCGSWDITESCFVEDLTVQNKCKICAPGFWMNSPAERCQKNNQINSNIAPNASNMIMSTLVTLLIAAFLLLN